MNFALGETFSKSSETKAALCPSISRDLRALTLLAEDQIPNKLCLKYVLDGFCEIEDVFTVFWEHVTFNGAG